MAGQPGLQRGAEVILDASRLSTPEWRERFGIVGDFPLAVVCQVHPRTGFASVHIESTRPEYDVMHLIIPPSTAVLVAPTEGEHDE